MPIQTAAEFTADQFETIVDLGDRIIGAKFPNGNLVILWQDDEAPEFFLQVSQNLRRPVEGTDEVAFIRAWHKRNSAPHGSARKSPRMMQLGKR